MPGEEEARGVVWGEVQGGKWNRTPAGTEAGGALDWDKVSLADRWFAKNSGGGGSFKCPSAMEGDLRLLKDKLPILFCVDREVTGFLNDRNRFQEVSVTGEVDEEGAALWVIGDGTESN